MYTHFLSFVKACAVIWHRLAFSLQRKINLLSHEIKTQNEVAGSNQGEKPKTQSGRLH